MRSAVLLSALALVLSGCSLPRGAALQSELVAGAENEARDFQLVPLTRANVAAVAKWPQRGSGYAAWPRGGLRTADPLALAAGDRLQITIYDNEPNSLLNGTNSRAATLQVLQVGRDGQVFLPYAGAVRLAGLSPDAARQKIQESLSSVQPSAQVLLNVEPGRANMAEISGSVGAPGSYPLPDRNFTALSLLSTAGGPAAGLRHPILRLMRNGTSHGIALQRLYDEPGLDLSLRGGDRLIVEDDRRSFLALGASGVQSTLPFTRADLTALDAVTQMGGLSPARADPKGVLVLRDYRASQLRRDGRGPDRERVIFAIDLTSTDGLFSARSFPLQDRDVVLATESPITQARTLFGLVGQIFGLADQATGN